MAWRETHRLSNAVKYDSILGMYVKKTVHVGNTPTTVFYLLPYITHFAVEEIILKRDIVGEFETFDFTWLSHLQTTKSPVLVSPSLKSHNTLQFCDFFFPLLNRGMTFLSTGHCV